MAAKDVTYYLRRVATERRLSVTAASPRASAAHAELAAAYEAALTKLSLARQ